MADRQNIEAFPGRKTVWTVYILGFLLGLHMALPAYILSTYLGLYIPQEYVGILYALASLLTIAMFSWLPNILKRFGNFRTSVAMLAVAGGSIAALGWAQAPLTAVLAFMVSYVAAIVLTFNFDIFLEHSSADRVTGEIRGTYLVAENTAWVVAQLVAGFILSDNNYSGIFLIAAAIVLPMLYLVIFRFGDFHDRSYEHISLRKLFRTAGAHREVIGVYITNTLLQFFYAWMLIYTPVYLHNVIGFGWSSISLMFAVMLVPFVVIQRPLGELADRVLGEKELMAVGFIIMAATSGLMAFVHTPQLLLWTMLLFVSRIGAATVEVMCETYFFKHVTDRDASLIGIFRTTRPWAYVVAPIVATLLLPFLGLQYLFLALGIIMLFGLMQALSLKDTK